MRFTVAICLLLTTSVSAAGEFRIHCRDGEMRNHAAKGRRGLLRAVCDVGAACDGSCRTLVGLDDGCVHCGSPIPLTEVTVSLGRRNVAKDRLIVDGWRVVVVCRPPRTPCE